MAGPSRVHTGFRNVHRAVPYPRHLRVDGVVVDRRPLVTLPRVTRRGADNCPGVFRPFLAHDGAIIRLRAPGGAVSVSLLAELVAIAGDFGAPMVQLTNRGNLQLRSLPDPLPTALIDRLMATGLLPSPEHERVRNIIAAPMNRALRSTVRDLDAAICADPALAQLPGRFLWAVSDSSGAVLGESWDLALQILDDDRAQVCAGGYAIAVPRVTAIGEMMARAHAFLADRDVATVWNIRDLAPTASVFTGMQAVAIPAPPALTPGPIGDAMVAGVPLGFLDSGHVRGLAALTADVTITPWRSLVIDDGAGAAGLLQDAGFAVSADSPWAHLSACVGAPSCRRSTSPTIDLVKSAATSMGRSGQRVHVVGCSRNCGQPAGEHISVVAPTLQDLVEVMSRV